MSEDIRKEVINFARSCDILRSKLVFGTTALTPVNLEEERLKFFASSTYNPVFTYNQVDLPFTEAHFRELRKQLDSLHLPHDLTSYLREYIQDLRLLYRTKKAIGSDDFSHYSKKLFKYSELVHKAGTTFQKQLTITKPEKEKMYSAVEIAEFFEYVLHDVYKMNNFTVCVDSDKGNIICTGTNKISIGKNVRRYNTNVLRLVVHEIESHALQFHNLSLHSHPFIRLTKYAESNLYSEGLAVYNEVQTGTITQKAYDEYWYRVKAVEMIDRSFREVYDYLRQHLSEKRAFQITYRVKRGMKNTKNAGGFPKDASYLLGYYAISEYVKSGLRPEFLYLSKSPYLTALLLRHGFLQKTNIKLPKFWEYTNTTHDTVPSSSYLRIL